MSQSPPKGYLNRKVSESIQDAVSNYTVDHIKTIVKAAIQRYIESFMDAQGGNRKLFEAITKMGLQYVTDRSFDPASDPSLRKTQIARLFEQVRQELPCILIMDSSFEYNMMNFTGIDKAWIHGTEWYGRIHISRTLKIMVVAGTRDQSSADFLHGLLSVLFGELRFLADGNALRGNRNNGETWCMTMGNPQLGKVNQNKVSSDPKDTIWFFDIEIPDILFEDHLTIKQPIYIPELGEGVMNPPGALGDVAPIIHFPNSIPINEPTQLMIDLFQPDVQEVFISNPNIAVYDPHTRIITARRIGKFKIQVMRYRKLDRDPVGEQTGRTFDVVAEKEVKVSAV